MKTVCAVHVRFGKVSESFAVESLVCCRMGKVSLTHLATGQYEMQDVKCAKCSAHLGWTYLKAFNEVCACYLLSQREVATL